MSTAQPAAKIISPATAPAFAAKHSLRFDRKWTLLLGLLAIVLVGLIAAAVGSVPIPAITVGKVLVGKLPFVPVVSDWPASYDAVLWQIRFPRVAIAAVAGAGLAISGATYQGLFRNPLADPYLIGVAAGAALGAVLAIAVNVSFGSSYGFGIVQLAAFAFALATVGLVYALARVGQTTPVTTLLLAGVALSALASALTTLLMYLHGDKLLAVYGWLLGGFALSGWEQVIATVPYVALGSVAILLYGRPLNVLQLDEEQAAQLGVSVERVKLILVIAATLITAAAVSVGGLIGFVGLIVPHIVRLLWGPDYRFLLPMSLIGGAVFLILADMLARSLIAPAELPVGAVTAFCGAPFFLYLLRQHKKMVF